MSDLCKKWTIIDPIMRLFVKQRLRFGSIRPLFYLRHYVLLVGTIILGFCGMKQSYNFRRFLKRMSEIIRQIFVSMHGAFITKKDYVDSSLKEFQDHVYDLNIDHISSDRANLSEDMNNLKKDFKKSVRSYKQETVNGEAP